MIIKLAESENELSQILELQNKNHLLNVSSEERDLNGFVTVKHNLELINRMNNRAKQVIAVDK
jgi:hypothetical protein